MWIGTPDDLCNDSRKLPDRYVPGEAMVVDPGGTVLCIFYDLGVFR